MLSRLLGSKTREKILKLFLLNPEHGYYIRQISRDLDLQVNSVRRELENLENLGILNSKWEKHDTPDSLSLAEKDKKNKPKSKQNKVNKIEKKYYYVNKNFVLYPSLRELMIKGQVLAGENFIKKVKEICQPKLLILTGLFVHKESVVDIFIVGKANRRKLNKLIRDLEKEVGRTVNFTLMNYSEFKYRQDITDVFLYNVLKEDKIVLLDKIGIKDLT